MPCASRGRRLWARLRPCSRAYHGGGTSRLYSHPSSNRIPSASVDPPLFSTMFATGYAQ